GYGFAIRMDTEAGWARGFLFLDATNTLLGGFGALGSADTITNLWIGQWHDNWWAKFTSTGMEVDGTIKEAGVLLSNKYAAIAHVSHNNILFPATEYDFATLPHAGINPMTIKLWDNYLQSGAPDNYGTLLDIYGKSSHEHSQLYFTNNTKILYRDAFYLETEWSAWKEIAFTDHTHSGVYLPLTGGTLTGLVKADDGIRGTDFALKYTGDNTFSGIRRDGVATEFYQIITGTATNVVYKFTGS
ncbi:unnamed protein product, partial [marine sediment metagenome]